MKTHALKPMSLICAVFALAMISVSGCSSGSQLNTVPRNAVDNSGVPSVTTDLCTAPTTRLIDPGERATTGATMGLRGAFSDIAQIPGTNFPGMVYTDAGAVALKYTYFNGSAFQTETIVGGLTTNFVRLVYLSSGKPLVFWANGATAVYMAVRSTGSLTDAGTWTVTAIENVATMTTRSVEAAVNPNNQVAVFYVNAAGTSARVLLCSANCDVAANYSGMGVVGNYITNTASASANSSDVQWCNAGGGVYYPYVTYGGTANSILARCNNANLATCLTPAGWQTASVTDGVNATGANQVMSKLRIDSGVDQPFYVVSRRSGTEIRAYKQNAGGCSTGAPAFSGTSVQVVASATIGNGYGSLYRDSANRWHLMANDGTTNIRYMNELTGTITNAWNANANIETTTIGAIGATRGGMMIDETGSQVLIAYGRTAGGTPVQTLGNLVLAFNMCATGAAGCLTSTLASPSSAAGMTWQNQPVDTSGQIQLVTGQIPNTVSVAATSAGIPAVTFVDFSAGAATSGRLKYAIRSGPSALDAWPSYDISAANQPQSVSLAFDHNNRPWIAYYDASSLRYYLLTNNSSDGSQPWTTYQFPTATATAPTLPAANNVALAMYYSGGVAKPVMIISNSGAATKVVLAARFNPTTESWGTVATVDTGVANFSRLSADFDTMGNIVLAYFDTTNSAIKYSFTTNGGTSWGAAAAVISSLGGMGLSIKINPATSQPAIAFYDRANGFVRYKYCSTGFASCLTSTNWLNLGLGLIDASAGVSGLTAAATDGLLSASLSFSPTGQAFVVYSSGAGSLTSSDMNISYVGTVTGLFSTPAALSPASNANIATPVAATPANFATGGWSLATVRTNIGSLHTVYVGPGNRLYVTSCGN